ncbi:CCA tRNA nucleotidyltransferase [Brevibacillus laterosporus]|uniref:CCA tRNA nucleotidyltransferase n=1 Tax=Brevibacillus laterosporus TaxID=1465 RepID=UPI0018F866B6|nr:hypothetical protein [Brevibacillus laterosporus]
MNIVQIVLDILHENGHSAYLVGGCVRDSLIGSKPKDYDIATSATPEKVIEIFDKSIPTGIQHGIVTVIEDGEHIEVTFRKDF